MRRPAVSRRIQEEAAGSLRLRVMTALIGGPIVLAAVWVGGEAWPVLMAVIALLGAPEIAQLYARGGWKAPVDTLVVAVLTPVALAYAAAEGLTPAGPTLLAVLALPVAYGLLRELGRPEPRLLTAGAVLSISVLYWGGLLAHLVLLRALPGGFAYGLTLVAGTWATDIAAFGVGRRWGRRRIAPRLSPGKTVEGTVGGMIVGLAVGWSTGWAAGLSWSAALPAAIAVVVAAPLGDLVESGLKREAGVKDSGALLPGHGGVLDRFDSLILAGAALYYVALLQQLF